MTRSLRALLACWIVASGGCSGGEVAQNAVPSDSTIVTQTHPLDARLLDRTIEQRIVIYVEATDSALDAARSELPEDDFYIIADDLMFYRAKAIEYLEKQQYPLLRMSGRRPLRFLVSGTPRSYDFSDVELFDFVVLYERDREPRIIAPNEIEQAAEFFSGLQPKP